MSTFISTSNATLVAGTDLPLLNTTTGIICITDGPGQDNIPSSGPPLLNCAIWLRADLGVTQVLGSVVAWADQSGTGNNFVNGAGGSPALTTSAINGQPGITCTGTQAMACASLVANISTTSTFYVVAHPGASGTRAIIDSRSAPNEMAIFATSTNEIMLVATTQTPGSAVFGNPHLYCMQPNYDGVHDQLFIDSFTTPDINVNKDTPRIFDQLFVGSNSTFAAPAGGPVCEVIVYTATHTLAQRTQVMQYLSQRYGIAVS